MLRGFEVLSTTQMPLSTTVYYVLAISTSHERMSDELAQGNTLHTWKFFASYISIAFGFSVQKVFSTFNLLAGSVFGIFFCNHMKLEQNEKKNQPSKHQLRQFRIWLPIKSGHWQYPSTQRCTKTFGNYRINTRLSQK